MIDKLVLDSSSKNSVFKLRDTLSKEIYPIVKSGRPIVLLCIGTDRSTGDSLGPLVGDKLKFLIQDRVFLYGTLQEPVHAKNLSSIINEVDIRFKNPFIIAIDACLGSIQNVGKIIIESKPLRPGSALNKDLPQVGDLSITGIVNISGAMEFMVLQNTRLFTVMQLVEVIYKGLYHSVLKTIGGKKSNNIFNNNLVENINV
jgi:putative sporulation protein YyaC